MNKEELKAMLAKQELKVTLAKQQAAMSRAQTPSTPRTPGKGPEKRNLPAMPGRVANKRQMLKAKLDSLSKKPK